MRKRRRLVNKIMTMSCAVMVAVSAFFYASIESEAKIVYDGDLRSYGVGLTKTYQSNSGSMFGYLSGDILKMDNGGTNSIETYWCSNDDYLCNWAIPVSEWNGGSTILSDKMFVRFYADITPSVSFTTNNPDIGFTNGSINITDAEIFYGGNSYSCQVGPLPWNSNIYRVSYSSIIDVPDGAFQFYSGHMVLRLKGNVSTFAAFDIDGASQYRYSQFSYNPTFNIKVGGIGGDYCIQIQNAHEEDSFLKDVTQDQTNSLNQATQNQTNELTNGFDNSKGDTVNSDLSAGLNEFQTAEDSLFSTASSSLSDYQFFNLSSVPAMVTGMSFVSSIMSSWFNQAGGASGVGIVLSILFSIMLVAMVLGLYRWYQSKGGKD